LWDPSKALLLTSRYHLGHGLAGKGRLNYLHTFYSLAKPGEYEFRPEIPLIDDVQSTNVQRLSIESNNNSHQAWTRVQIQSYNLRHRRRPEISSPISSGNSLKISPTQEEPDWIAHLTMLSSHARYLHVTPRYQRRRQKAKSLHLKQPRQVYQSGGEDSSDDEHEQTIGGAWLTYEHPPLHETVQEREYSWVLLARENDFRSGDGGFVTRPDNFPEGYLIQSDSHLENGGLPWMV
jgi:hypothetical protein